LKNLSVYNKPYQSPADLVNYLERRGLNFDERCDKEKAEFILKQINHYRFKGYLIPFLKENDDFIEGSTFNHGVELYEFDTKLRELCNEFILKIEVKLKSHLDQTLSSATNDPFWYLNDDNFHMKYPPNYLREKVRKSMADSKTLFAVHYKKKYFSPKESYRSLPPFWVASELLTFGDVCVLFNGIHKDKVGPQRSNPLDILAQSFGAKNIKELKSWLPLIKSIRNSCSHSNRTWNANYRLPKGFVNNENKAINDKVDISPTMKNKLYLGLVIIHLMSKNNLINGASFKDKVLNLLKEHEHIEYLKRGMGIPESWDSEDIWNA